MFTQKYKYSVIAQTTTTLSIVSYHLTHHDKIDQELATRVIQLFQQVLNNIEEHTRDQQNITNLFWNKLIYSPSQ